VSMERSPPGPNTVLFILEPPIARSDIRALCGRLIVLLLKNGGDLVVCDVGALVDPDACIVDTLARLQVTAQRLGCGLRIRGARPELLGLLELTGLRGVVAVGE
jgi:anti-anti-sigma regulatory factor